ncbi:MAG: hypothetical protein QXJ06_02820 [Candidatus Aenigmatarchaeota archaeon]
MKKFAVFSLLFIALFLSGCTQNPGGGGSTNGIIIESFGPVVSQLEPGDTTDIIAVLKNTGGAEAQNINVQLYGLSDWNPRTVTQPPSVMMPGDPVRNIEPETAEVVWEVTAPKYKTGIDNQEFEMRVYYSYSTKALATIKVASDNYIKSFPSSEQQAKIQELGVKMDKPTDGPIRVSISAPSKVIRAGSNTVRITIDIQNVGSGNLENYELPIRVSSSLGSIQCSNTGTVKLLQGKSKQIRCSLNVNLDKGWENIPVEVTLENYRYWVSATSSISVLPTED